MSVSPQRFSSVQTSAAGASVVLSGAPGENVTVEWQDPSGKVVSKSCVIAAADDDSAIAVSRRTVTMGLSRRGARDDNEYDVSCTTPAGVA